jgi:hypothetical protein
MITAGEHVTGKAAGEGQSGVDLGFDLFPGAEGERPAIHLAAG